jgi:peptide chain release factor 1
MEADQKMMERLDSATERLAELERQLNDPVVMADQKEFVKLSKELGSIRPAVEEYTKYKEIIERILEDEAIIESSDDEELAQAARSELADLEEEREESLKRLKSVLLTEDADDQRRAIIEIRAGTGGEEAGLFAADLYRMYSKYAEFKGWKTDPLSSHPTEIGGFKEVIFLVEGKGAYSKFKFESGVHRVQRVPATESGGRIHTSTATVAVLPEAEEVEVEIDPRDLRIDTFRASGPGGQYVNVTDSATRITHIPTGIVVSCQDERSQHKNKAKAMKILKARLLDRQRQEQEEEIAKNRRKQVGRGERSEKVRTYNFPQRRVTDHRIGVSLYNLERVLEGDLDQLIDKLTFADEESRIADE